MASHRRKKCVIFIAVALMSAALALFSGVALNGNAYNRPPQLSYVDCSTVSARQHGRLPGVCLLNTTCTYYSCCYPDSFNFGRDPLSARGNWIDAVETSDAMTDDRLEPRWSWDTALTKDANVITVTCSFISIDMSFYTTTVLCDIENWGRFDKNGRFAVNMSDDSGTVLQGNIDNVTLVISLGGTMIELKDGDFTPSGVHLDVGLGVPWVASQDDVDFYPNFKLPFQLWFAAWWWKNSTQEIVGGEPPVVVTMDVNYIPFYTMSGDCISTRYDPGSAWYSVIGSIQLSHSAKSGVFNLNICMWFLAAMTCIVSIVWCMLRTPKSYIPFDLTCFSATLLFALPTMRALLPAMPAAGTQYDIVNLYGQLWLVTISIMLQIAKILCGVVDTNPNPWANWVHWLPEQCRKCCSGGGGGPGNHPVGGGTAGAGGGTADAGGGDHRVPAVQRSADSTSVAVARTQNTIAVGGDSSVPAVQQSATVAESSAAPVMPSEAAAASGGVVQQPAAASGGVVQQPAAASGGVVQQPAAASGGVVQQPAAASGGVVQQPAAASGGVVQQPAAAPAGAAGAVH